MQLAKDMAMGATAVGLGQTAAKEGLWPSLPRRSQRGGTCGEPGHRSGSPVSAPFLRLQRHRPLASLSRDTLADYKITKAAVREQRPLKTQGQVSKANPKRGSH